VLLARAGRGDPEAFSCLVRRHRGSLVLIAMAYVPGHAEAQEVVQQTWLVVIESLHRLVGRSAFRTWLFASLVERARAAGVLQGRADPFSAMDGRTARVEPAISPSQFGADGRWTAPPWPWEGRLLSNPLVDAETKEALRAAIEALPCDERAVVTMRDIEGLSAADVYTVLRISEGSQSAVLHRARARLRQALAERLEGRRGRDHG
jgi:RNA polymerase sigma-70 factor (ECF subfamily)